MSMAHACFRHFANDRRRICVACDSGVFAQTLVCLALFVVSAPVAAAQDRPARLIDLEGREHTGVVTMLSANGITLTSTEGGPSNFQRDRILSIDWAGKVAAHGSQQFVLLANGDRLVVRPQMMDDQAATALWPDNPEWAAVRIPLETIRGMVLDRPVELRQLADQYKSIFDRTDASDAVYFRNGDRASGELVLVVPDALTLETAAGPTRFDRSKVQGVAFNPQLTSFPRLNQAECCLVTLFDGSEFLARSVVETGAGELRIAALFGGELQIPQSAVSRLQFFGTKVDLLEDVPRGAERFTPYLSGTWPARTGRNAAGGPLQIQGRVCTRGLGMHSEGEVDFPLQGKYRSFRATIGLDDLAAGNGHAIAVVLADGKTIYTSPPLTGANPVAETGLLSIAGAQTLTLRVEFGERGDVLDYINWCDAVLVK